MLKIKDNVDLNKFRNIGSTEFHHCVGNIFKEQERLVQTVNSSVCVSVIVEEGDDVVIFNTYELTLNELFDLIKAELVEKAEDNE